MDELCRGDRAKGFIRTGTRVANVFGSKAWSGWYLVGLLSRVVRNCLENWSSDMLAAARRFSSRRRRTCGRAAKARFAGCGRALPDVGQGRTVML